MSKKVDLSEAESNPNSGHYWKKLGNEAFTKGDYQQAIEHYSKAIGITDNESIFYSNRARCYKNIKEYKKAYEDAKLAVELEQTNIKAHLICGQMLSEMAKEEPGVEKLNLALSRMTKALTLCAGQGKQVFERDLNKNILRIKKLRWYKEEEIKTEKKIQFLSYIKGLIDKESALSSDEKKQKYQDVVELIGDPKKSKTFEIPEYLCCKLTKTIMEDPVATLEGITYEKEALMEYFKKHGAIDPTTSQQVNQNCIYPNLNIKQAIESFLKDNPWAFEYVPGETKNSIEF